MERRRAGREIVGEDIVVTVVCMCDRLFAWNCRVFDGVAWEIKRWNVDEWKYRQTDGCLVNGTDRDGHWVV
jgi:hypothetical protein